MSLRVLLPAILCCSLPGFAQAETRTGDAGIQAPADDTDKYYPIVATWAEAGVTGGLQALDDAEPSAATDATSIQAAIDASEGGVIQLPAGEITLVSGLRLKTGVVLRGHADGTTLVYQQSPAIVLDGTSKAGLADVRLAFADPDDWSAGAHRRPGYWTDAPGFEGAAPAVRLHEANDCFLDGVTIARAASAPLAVSSSRHCTLRSVHVHGVGNRGPGSGEILFADNEALLVSDLRVRGARRIILRSANQASVFRSCVLSTGFRFHRGDESKALLFEDCHFIFEPGTPFRPFAKGPMPIGPDSMVMNCSAYHHGTDAVVPGVLMEDGFAYVIQTRSLRGAFDPVSLQYRKPKFVHKHQMQVDAQAQKMQGNKDAISIAPTWDQAPAGLLSFKLGNNLYLNEWLSTGPVDRSIGDAAIGDLIAKPLVAGAQASINGVQATPAALADAVKIKPKDPDPLHVQKMEAKFGIKLGKAKGAQVDLLKALDKDWKAGCVWQACSSITAPVTIIPDWKRVGATMRVYIGETELKPKQAYRLEPGTHGFTALIKAERKPPFIKQARIAIQITLKEERATDKAYIDTPKPRQGRLYTLAGSKDELADLRPALAAWFAYFGKFRKGLYPEMISDAKKLQSDFPDTLIADQAKAILQVLAEAPYQESEELSQRQWGELLDYYARMGIPERKWSLGKAGKGSKVRTYYPEEEVE